jgi:hypothetical protein
MSNKCFIFVRALLRKYPYRRDRNLFTRPRYARGRAGERAIAPKIRSRNTLVHPLWVTRHEQLRVFAFNSHSGPRWTLRGLIRNESELVRDEKGLLRDSLGTLLGLCRDVVL